MNLYDKFYQFCKPIAVYLDLRIDLVQHAVVGFGLGGVLVFVLVMCGIDPFASMLVTMIVLGVIAVGKEIYDRVVKKTVIDLLDIEATLYGGILGVLVSLLLSLCII